VWQSLWGKGTPPLIILANFKQYSKLLKGIAYQGFSGFFGGKTLR
jgi:hypothetical protein